MTTLKRLTGLVFPPTLIQVEEATKAAERAQRQSVRLAVAARRWQAEAKELRKATHLIATARIVERSHDAARQLCILHLSQFRTGRVVATQYGVSERYYFWGRALCELAAIYADGQFTTDDPEIMENNLEVAARAALKNFSLLTRRLPPSRRPKFRPQP